MLPTKDGCAVFLGNKEKVFIIYVDVNVGAAITMFIARDATRSARSPHDLMANLMMALGAKVERVVINELKSATYYARLIISAENELQQRKIIEIDAPPERLHRDGDPAKKPRSSSAATCGTRWKTWATCSKRWKKAASTSKAEYPPPSRSGGHPLPA